MIEPDNQLLCKVSAGEHCKYKFTATKDAKYIFSYSEAPYTSGEDFDCKLYLMNEDGSIGDQIASDSSTGGFTITFDSQAGETYCFDVYVYPDSASDECYVNLKEDVYSASVTAKINKETGKATIKGTATGDTFGDIYVDDIWVKSVSGKENFTTTISMKKYDVGYHKIYVTLETHDKKIKAKTLVPTYIYNKPSNKISYFTSKTNTITYTFGGSNAKNCKIILEYKKAGAKKWKKTKAFKPGNSFTIKKLSMNKKYKVRAYYVYTGKNNGKKYTFKGKKSKAVTIKTGAKKPKIKSVTVNKAKVETRSGVSYEWRSTYLGGTFYFYRVAVPYSYKVTTTTVTIKLKKKPGAAGIYANGIKLSGNKKTYKTTMTFYGSLVGKKVKINVYSYQSTKYGGYSKTASKKAKVKK